MKPKIEKYPIWKKHEWIKEVRCGGNWRIKKFGRIINTEDYPYEFECDKCRKKFSIMNIRNLTRKEVKEIEEIELKYKK